MGERSKGDLLALGVGRSSHRACAIGAGGEVLFNREVANGPADVDRALADAGPGVRVIVDQRRSMGALVVARARAAGSPVSCLPGIAARRARDMFPATARTDATGAEAVARTAAGMSRTLREVAGGGCLYGFVNPSRESRHAAARPAGRALSHMVSRGPRPPGRGPGRA